MKSNTRAIAVLFAILFLVMMGFGIVIPIMPFFVTDLGGGPTVLGLFMASYSLMQFFFAPFWGRLSDRIGRRPVLLIGLLGYGFTFILFGFASKLWMIFAIRILSGIISSATLPTAMAYIADTTEGNERSKGMGLMGAAMGMGMIFGPAIGGWLGHHGFALPFFAAGALCLLTFPFAFFFLSESLKEKTIGNTRFNFKLSMDTIRHPLFLLFTLAFISNFTMAMFETTFALFAAAKIGFGPRELGILFAVLGVVGVIVQGSLIGRLVKRFGDINLIKGGLFIAAVGMLSILDAHSMFFMLVTTSVFYVGISLISPSLSTLVTKNSLDGQGVSLGLMQSFGSLGRIIGPVTGGILYGANISIPYFSGAAFLLLILGIAGKRINKYAV